MRDASKGAESLEEATRLQATALQEILDLLRTHSQRVQTDPLIKLYHMMLDKCWDDQYGPFLDMILADELAKYFASNVPIYDTRVVPFRPKGLPAATKRFMPSENLHWDGLESYGII